MRYDEERRVYRHCQWCNGAGCLACRAEADAEYKRQFPDGPKPIASFKLPEELEEAKKCIGADALNRAFGPDGKGVREIVENIEKVKGKT